MKMSSSRTSTDTQSHDRGVAYPVTSLRKQCTALEAAIELVLMKPRKRPVHLLRTSTRRVEAQLHLLHLLERTEPALKGFSRKRVKLAKLLAAVRRAAGNVRDLDVQRDLIKQVQTGGSSKRLRKEAKHLRKKLAQQRADDASSLLRELQGHARKLGPKLEKLMTRLEPAANIMLTEIELARLIRSWYESETASAGRSAESLHSIRKIAKLARYMAEAGGNKSVADHFENTQQLGGTWHDALTLRQAAATHLGPHSSLLEVFAEQESHALLRFEQHLEQISRPSPGRPRHNAGTTPRARTPQR